MSLSLISSKFGNFSKRNSINIPNCKANYSIQYNMPNHTTENCLIEDKRQSYWKSIKKRARDEEERWIKKKGSHKKGIVNMQETNILWKRNTCVPQSPTWFRRSTSIFENSSIRARVSPIIVDLKWPTCISFAILGEEKSTTALLTEILGAQVSIPSISIFWIFCSQSNLR